MTKQIPFTRIAYAVIGVVAAFVDLFLGPFIPHSHLADFTLRTVVLFGSFYLIVSAFSSDQSLVDEDEEVLLP